MEFSITVNADKYGENARQKVTWRDGAIVTDCFAAQLLSMCIEAARRSKSLMVGRGLILDADEANPKCLLVAAIDTFGDVLDYDGDFPIEPPVVGALN